MICTSSTYKLMIKTDSSMTIEIHDVNKDLKTDITDSVHKRVWGTKVNSFKVVCASFYRSRQNQKIVLRTVCQLALAGDLDWNFLERGEVQRLLRSGCYYWYWIFSFRRKNDLHLFIYLSIYGNKITGRDYSVRRIGNHDIDSIFPIISWMIIVKKKTK